MVIIKDMKMPANCEECLIRNDKRCNLTNSYINPVEYFNLLHRRPDCPLEEIEESI